MTHGAVASGDIHSTEAGAAMLRAGGNAVDAAVASGLVACVTLPTMTGLGGGGIMTLLVDGRVTVCDLFSNVPGLGLNTKRERELDVVTVSFEGIDVDFRVRAPSIAVPGTVAGLWEIHMRHGRLPLAEVAAPAIQAARRGYEVTGAQRKAFLLLHEIFRMSPDTWSLMSTGDDVADVGETLRNPDLADTIQCLVEEGPAPFYEGDIARAIVDVSEGWVTPQDLASYTPIFREPVEGSYRRWSLHLPAMPSVTGGMILSALRALEAGGALPRPLDVAAWGRLADAMSHAEAVRTDEYERRLFEDGFVQSLVAGTPGGNTMHISTADEDGTFVSYTTTVGESAGLVAPGTGVAMNNFLGEEDILPVGGLRAAGRRMMTSMCPVILHDGRKRRIALGSAGSARIKTAILQLVVHLIDGGLPPDEAVKLPRIHVEADTLYVEGYGRTDAQVGALSHLRRKVETTWECGFFFGGAQVAERNGTQFLVGADEERRGCTAVVV